MIVQCPACQSRYRISDSRIPAKGGNLKCPSCSHTFFVAGPETSAGTGGGTGKTPAASPAPARSAPDGQPKEALDEVARALLDQLDDDDWLGGGTSPIPSAAAAEPSPPPAAAPATPEVEPAAKPAAAPTLSESARSKLDSSLGDSLDDELASVLAAASGAVGGGDDDSPSPSAGAAGGGAGADEDRWKVRTNMGLVFDFPDRKALRKWLGTRDTHEGMTISRDGGLTWNSVAETEGVSDIRPSIVRAGLGAGAGLGRRSGSVSAVQDAETRRAPAVGGRAAAMTGNSRHVDIPISTSEGQAARRSAIWFVLLIIVIAAAGGLHYTGVVEIPGIPAPVQRSTQTPPPAPAPTPAPVAVEEDEDADGDGASREESAEAAAQRVSMNEIYDATLDRARRQLGEENFDGAMRTAQEAQQLIPTRPEAFCVVVDIASAADHEEEEIERHRVTCEEKRAEAEARAAQQEADAEEGEGDAEEDPPAE